MLYRLFLSAALLLVIFGAAHALRDRGIPTEPATRTMKAEDLPKTVGDWEGKAVDLDPHVFQHIGAVQVIDRRYSDRLAHVVSLHLAVFDHFLFGPQNVPHMPELCYETNGWRLEEPKLIALGAASGDDLAKLLPAQRNGETIYVLYWYQFDGHVYSDGPRQRQLFLGLRGRATIPPVVKVMLQTIAPNAEAAEKILLPFAKDVFKWTKEFH